MPGLVRVGFGAYKAFAEVDRLLEAPGRIARGAYSVPG
jgi:hypothetical protein